MPIAIRCKCGKRLLLRDELAGKRGICPACKETFLIQEADEAAESDVAEVEASAAEEKENDDAEAPDERAKRPKKKKSKKKRGPIKFNTGGGWSLFPSFLGDMRILGMSPGCLLIGILILAGAGLTAYFTVPGLGPVMCYKAVELRDDAFTASYEVQVVIFNTPAGYIDQTLSTGFVTTDRESGKRTVRSKERVSTKFSRSVGDKTVQFGIEWTEDQGVHSVTCDGKNVPRSIFSTSAQSR